MRLRNRPSEPAQAESESVESARAAEPSASIRVRIMWTMVLLAGIALAASGAVVTVLQEHNIRANATEQLQRILNQFRSQAASGIYPATGEQFMDSSQALETFLSRSIMGEAEGELGFVGTTIAWVASPDVELRPEDDQELLAAVADYVSGNTAIIEPIRTRSAEYIVLVAPISVGADHGALLHVIDLGVSLREFRNTMLLYGVTAFITLALIAVLAWLAADRLLRPIEDLRKAAQSIDERDLKTRVPVRGRDDLAALAVTMNRMLDRIERSVEGQRELLDDVGHELRTPITVVRGHLELVDPHDEEDVRQTRALVLDELDRMGVLVNDLLELARASTTDFVQMVPCQIAELTEQVFEKARALEERPWSLESTADIETSADPIRITQAWLQLAANAVKYSDPGSPVALGSAVHGNEVHLWVRDQGIGIAPQDIERVRQRFGRIDTAGWEVPGSGLGLSIVETIVTAHGGSLDIESTLGEGSLFTLRLPITTV